MIQIRVRIDSADQFFPNLFGLVLICKINSSEMAVQLVIIITLNMEKFGREIVLNPNYEMAITFESF